MPHYQSLAEATDTCYCGKGKSALEHVCSECYRTGQGRKPRVPIPANRRAIVIHDPSDTYPPGSWHIWGEFESRRYRSEPSTLMLGFWPPGMIVEDPRGGRWIVRGNEGVPASAPEKKFKPQRLEPVRGRRTERWEL